MRPSYQDLIQWKKANNKQLQIWRNIILKRLIIF